ncbi:retrotransposon protein, putative, ty1-copia subclass [Tanacetum coccineum]
MALSSCEAEFMAATTIACQEIWLRVLLAEVTGNEQVIVEHVFRENQKADPLTKALARIRFKEMISLLGVQELPSSIQKFKGSNIPTVPISPASPTDYENLRSGMRTKRAKHNLDSTYLWHCRLAHISKKRIEKLQQEGLLKSIDDELIDQCVSCLSGRMTRKSFSHRPKRATDLLGIIHTDVCGPLRHVSRQGLGCEALVKRDTPDKLQQRSVKCIFIGYLKETMGYYFFLPTENKIVVARYVEFFEKNLITQEVIGMAIVLVDLPPGCKTVGSKLIFKKKTDMDGIVHTYKACLVAKGYTQLYGVDYEETFSPVADIRAIRILISIAAFYDYEIWQIDVKTAFLNGYLDKGIYMVQPEGFVDPKHPRKASGSNVTFLILYVDDLIIMGKHIPSLQSVKDYLRKCFAMKDLGEATFILEIKIYRDRSKRLIGLGQNAYMDKILKRYKMDNSKRGHISMQERLDLNKTQGASTPKEVKRMQNVPYASVWVPLCMQNTKDMFLVYGGNPEAELRVDCYCNAGFEIDINDMKSLTGYLHKLNCIVASEAEMEAVWIRKFVSGLGIVPIIKEPIRMFCDNSAALHFANEPRVQKGTRHYHRKISLCS